MHRCPGCMPAQAQRAAVMQGGGMGGGIFGQQAGGELAVEGSDIAGKLGKAEADQAA